jgi:hypothetical protein
MKVLLQNQVVVKISDLTVETAYQIKSELSSTYEVRDLPGHIVISLGYNDKWEDVHRIYSTVCRIVAESKGPGGCLPIEAFTCDNYDSPANVIINLASTGKDEEGVVPYTQAQIERLTAKLKEFYTVERTGNTLKVDLNGERHSAQSAIGKVSRAASAAIRVPSSYIYNRIVTSFCNDTSPGKNMRSLRESYAFVSDQAAPNAPGRYSSRVNEGKIQSLSYNMDSEVANSNGESYVNGLFANRIATLVGVRLKKAWIEYTGKDGGAAGEGDPNDVVENYYGAYEVHYFSLKSDSANGNDAQISEYIFEITKKIDDLTLRKPQSKKVELGIISSKANELDIRASKVISYIDNLINSMATELWINIMNEGWNGCETAVADIPESVFSNIIIAASGLITRINSPMDAYGAFIANGAKKVRPRPPFATYTPVEYRIEEVGGDEVHNITINIPQYKNLPAIFAYKIIGRRYAKQQLTGEEFEALALEEYKKLSRFSERRITRITPVEETDQEKQSKEKPSQSADAGKKSRRQKKARQGDNKKHSDTGEPVQKEALPEDDPVPETAIPNDPEIGSPTYDAAEYDNTAREAEEARTKEILEQNPLPQTPVPEVQVASYGDITEEVIAGCASEPKPAESGEEDKPATEADKKEMEGYISEAANILIDFGLEKIDLSADELERLNSLVAAGKEIYSNAAAPVDEVNWITSELKDALALRSSVALAEDLDGILNPEAGNSEADSRAEDTGTVEQQPEPDAYDDCEGEEQDFEAE